MMSDTICRFITAVVLCTVLLIGGCGGSTKQTPVEFEETDTTRVEPEKKVEMVVEPEKKAETVVEPEKKVETVVEPEKKVETVVEPAKEGPKVKLALKFEPNDVTTYKVTTHAAKSVLWEGPEPSKPSAFKGGRTSNEIELSFSQLIKSVDAKGVAIARITIKQLKYVAKVRDNTVLDFDSTKEEGKTSPLNNLIGQSYTIEITPAGQVLKVLDVSEAQAAVKGSTPAHKTAQALVSPTVIKERHAIPGLPAEDKNNLSQGDKWSRLKTFNFGMMGAKSYERIYKLKEIKDSGDGKLAVATMDAVPSSANAAELHKDQPEGFLSKLFDNKENYSGQLMLNLKTGKIQMYTEKLMSEWLAVDPESAQKPDSEPAALRMTATRLYQIERID